MRGRRHTRRARRGLTKKGDPLNDFQQPPGLIWASGPVSYSMRGPLPRPGVAVVYVTKSGQVVSLAGRPPLRDVGRYQGWHLVDVSRHHDLIAADVPSLVDSMFFHFEADVVWGVTDPALIVTHNTMDGLGLVQSRLVDQVRRMTRQYDVDNCPDAERRLQSEYSGGPLTLPDGLTVHSIVVRLRTDESTAEFQHNARQLQRAGVTDEAEHANQRHREERNAELEKTRIEALRQIANGEDDLLFIFLSRNPDQVGTVLQTVAQRRELTIKAQFQLFDKMVEQGFIQEADIEPMRRLLLEPLENLADTSAQSPLSGGGVAQPPALTAGPPELQPQDGQQPGGNGAPAPQDGGRAAHQGPVPAGPGDGQQPEAGSGVAGWRPFGPGPGDGHGS
jgi:hypothetical protein